MSTLQGLSPQKVFSFFEEICAIPHGSSNRKPLADYCVDFAKNRGLKFHRDAEDNVILWKRGTSGREGESAVILQGHLDMVCQKTADSTIDFEKDGICLSVEGDFVTAQGTTLGADNGIAVAMILSVLDSEDISHPPIEAVFTSDEEIGMLGAVELDMGLLTSKRMINLDAEEEDTLTVSCAGGSNVTSTLSLQRESLCGYEVTISLFGLLGGHSGVEIDKGRVNANLLAGRLLHHLNEKEAVSLYAIAGGDKANAIPCQAEISLLADKTESICQTAQQYLSLLKQEISDREPQFTFSISVADERKERLVFSKKDAETVIFSLLCLPDGVQSMSAEVNGLVETSLNLGVLKTEETRVLYQSALRSNKASALAFLEEKLLTFYRQLGFETKSDGHYPPWEFKKHSALQSLYSACYQKQFGKTIKVEALHAGLECAVFASKIPDLDCIAVGPNLYDVHTVKEKMSISSVQNIYRLLLTVLAEL